MLNINNQETGSTIHSKYFRVLWQGKKAQALPKLHKYLHNHGSCGFLLKCIGLLR